MTSTLTTLSLKSYITRMLKVLKARHKGILMDRYGLWNGLPETLQEIADKHAVTRERIRQIQVVSLKRLRAEQPVDFLRVRVAEVAAQPKFHGVLTRAEVLAELAEGETTVDEVKLAIGLIQDIGVPLAEKHGEPVDLLVQNLFQVEEGVYCTEEKLVDVYEFLLRRVVAVLTQRARPTTRPTLYHEASQGLTTSLQTDLLNRVVAVSPSLVRFRKGMVALAAWPAMRRRNAANMAELALQMAKRPLHFREIAEHIKKSFPDVVIDVRTVHNAIISSKKFVWVKPGTYGLATWGLKTNPHHPFKSQLSPWN